MKPVTTRRARKPAYFRSLFLLASVLLLTACSLPKVSLPDLTRRTPAAETPTAISPAEATPTEPSAAEEREPTATQPVVNGSGGISLEGFTAADGTVSGVILFNSRAEDPFLSDTASSRPITREMVQLWGISIDGGQAGLLSTTGGAIYPTRSADQPTLLLDSDAAVSNPVLQPVALPAACDPAAGGSCSGFQFSPNGRLLLYFSGQSSCGQSLTLYEIGSQSALKTWTETHWARFLQDGSVVLSIGDCQKQQMYLYYPNKDTQATIGTVGVPVWNQSANAFLMQVRGDPVVQSGLWGLNFASSRVFLWLEQQRVIQDTPIWLPDGQHVVYQHRGLRYDDGSGDAILQSPRQIIVMNAWTRDQRLLAYDSSYNYHLCSTTGEPCDAVSGDWLKAHRTLMAQSRFPAEEYDGLPAARCGLFGLDCPEGEEEVVAINWKTGQIVPWNEAGIPEPEPLSPFAPPDMESEPVYSDPAGAFALVTGVGGHALWYIPQTGEPVLWVADGENFVYLP